MRSRAPGALFASFIVLTDAMRLLRKGSEMQGGGKKAWGLFLFAGILLLGGGAQAQSEILNNQQSGISALYELSVIPDNVSALSVLGSVADVFDIGFSYVSSPAGRSSPLKSVSIAAHFHSQVSDLKPQFAALLETNTSRNAFFYGVELYTRKGVNRKVVVSPALTVGLFTISGQSYGDGYGHSFSPGSRSVFSGSAGIAIALATGKSSYLVISPQYSFIARSPDVLGVSLGLLFHSKGHARHEKQSAPDDYYPNDFD